MSFSIRLVTLVANGIQKDRFASEANFILPHTLLTLTQPFPTRALTHAHTHHLGERNFDLRRKYRKTLIVDELEYSETNEDHDCFAHIKAHPQVLEFNVYEQVEKDSVITHVVIFS